MSKLQCSIVTPAQSVLDEEASYVSFQAFDGQQGVMNGASAFLAKLGSGVCRVDGASGRSEFVLSGGFAQMNKNRLVLLADSAEVVSQINADEAAKQVEQADAMVTAVNEKPLSLAQRESIETAQCLARARLAAARKR